MKLKNLLKLKTLLLLGLLLKVWTAANAQETIATAVTITPTTTLQTYSGNLNYGVAETFTYINDSVGEFLYPYTWSASTGSMTTPTIQKDKWLKFVATNANYEINLYGTTSTEATHFNIQIFRAHPITGTLMRINKAGGWYKNIPSTLSSYFGLPIKLGEQHSTLIKGSTYYIRISTPETSTASQAYTVSYKYTNTTAPNDEIHNAISLPVGDGICSETMYIDGYAYYNVNETISSVFRPIEGNSFGQTVWYKFVAPPSGHVKITTDHDYLNEEIMQDHAINLFRHNGGSFSDYNNYTMIYSSPSELSEDIYHTRTSTLYAPSLLPGATYYIQFLTYLWEENKPFCMTIEELNSTDIADPISCSTGPAKPYYYYLMDTVLRTHQYFQFKYGNYGGDPISAMIRNDNGLNNNYLTYSANQVTSTIPRSTTDGRLYSNNYYSLGNTAADAGGVYHVLFFMKRSHLEHLGIIGEEFKITRVPGNCISTITPELEATAIDIEPDHIRYTADSLGLYIKILTSELGTFFIRKNAPVSIATHSFTNPSCYAGNNGTASITIENGTEPFTYTWSGISETTSSVSGLSAGEYTVTVTDAAGTSASHTFILTEPSPISAISIVTNTTCSDTNDGSVNLTINGGTAPYNILWSDGNTSTNRSALEAGIYSYTITDDNDCSYTNSVTIGSPSIILASFIRDEITCYGANDGSIYIYPTGGTPGSTTPYNYSWSNGATTQHISDLGPGLYSVVITDMNSCTYEISVNMLEPAGLDVSLTTNDVTCFGANDGSGTITTTPSISSASIVWSNGEIGHSANSLTPGSHSVTITRDTGCTQSYSFNIEEPILITTNVDLSTCAGDTIVVNGNSYFSNQLGLEEVYTSSSDCDSIVIYNLNFENSGIINSSIDIDGYLINDTAHFTSTTCQAVAKIESAEDLGLIQVQLFIEPASPTTVQPFVERYYDIHTENEGGGVVTLYFTNEEFENYNDLVGEANPDYPQIDATSSNLMVTAFHSMPGSGSAPGGYDSLSSEALPCTAIWNSEELRWEVTFTTTSFSGFFVHTSMNGAPLNMEYIILNGQNHNGYNILKWSSTNNDQAVNYEVEKSTNSRDFNIVDKLKMNQINNYSFKDSNTNLLNYYRIVQIDQDGNKHYSKTIMLKNSNQKTQVSLHPNPTTDKIEIIIDQNLTVKTKAELMDVNGKIIYTTVFDGKSTTVDMSQLPQGIYFLQLNNENLNSTHKVIKQ